MTMLNSSTKKVHNPRHDLRVPYFFFATPVAVQCMYRIIRAHVDKYARVDLKYQSIGYSRWDEATHSYIKCTMTRTEAQRVFDELYPPAVTTNGAKITHVFVDECD